MTDHHSFRGFVATAPESRLLPDGTAVTSFRMASTARWYDAESGQWKDGHTNWYTVKAFRTLATNAAACLKVGHPVLVQGRLRVRTWESETGRRTSVDVEATALGPDLSFGTAGFSRNSSAAATESAEGPGAAAPEHEALSAAGEDPSDVESADAADAGHREDAEDPAVLAMT